MANPQPVYWGTSSDPLINAATTGYMWVLGADKTVDWSVANGFGGEVWTNPQSVAQEALAILSTFSYYANIKFNFVGYYDNPSAAYEAGSDMTMSLSGSWSFFPSSSIWARAMFSSPQPTYYYGDAGDVYLNINSQANYLSSYAPGTAGWMVFLHEMGHALGLKHPHDDGGTGRPTLTQLGLSQLNDDWGTIMSYQDDYNWNLRQWDPATPMALDVIALQYLYGPNMATNTGDTIFQLTRQSYYETYWDASGNDAVDVSGSSEGWVVVLPNFQPSTVISTKVGLATPMADVGLVAPRYLAWLTGDMENVRGSAYSDVIVGTSASNLLDGRAGNDVINGGWGDDILIGGAGNDTIDGGGGYDVAYLSGIANTYQTSVEGSTRTMLGADGSDTYSNVFRFHFSNVSVAYDIDGHAGQAYRLYKAAFDRLPDLGGMGYQMHALDVGLSLSQVAGNFIASPEFQSKYGNVDNTQFISLLYQNVLNRAPDLGGLQFHLDELARGESRADLLTHFSESPENQLNVIGLIGNGIVYTG